MCIGFRVPNGLAVENDACFLGRLDYEHVVSMGYLCGYGKGSERGSMGAVRDCDVSFLGRLDYEHIHFEMGIGG